MLHLRKQGTYIAALQVGAAGWEVIMENVFAKRLKQAREERGMLQGELADRCGMVLSAFKEYESGRVLPRVDKVIVLAQELDCSTDFLCGLEN